MSTRLRSTRRAGCLAVLLLTSVIAVAARDSPKSLRTNPQTDRPKECTISVTSGVAFGSYDVFATGPVDSLGTISVDCSKKNTKVQIALTKGGSPTFQPRQLVSGVYHLAYNLYLDSARTQIWGDGTGGSTAYSAKLRVAGPVILNIYGRIPARQDVGVGSYADSITVVVLF